MSTLEEQVVELETKLAYQEDTIQALNDVVAEQQKQLDKLERSLVTLAERFKEMSTGDSFQEQGNEPPPPHY